MGDRLGIHSAVDFLFNDYHLYSVVGMSTESGRVDKMKDAYSPIWILSGACNTQSACANRTERAGFGEAVCRSHCGDFTIGK